MSKTLTLPASHDKPAISYTRILTGRAAQRNVADLIGRAQQEKLSPDAQLPVSSRAQRRAADRKFARQQRKGKASYMKWEMAKQRIVADLAKQFDIIDGHVPAPQHVHDRVMLTMAEKADQMVERGDAADSDTAWLQLRTLAGATR